ncbi:hypothetical protein BBP40_012682 [Aspergillus hancockii]|nr:hypothetical protein BBP40_012682 [Aspergillus hancockii]
MDHQRADVPTCPFCPFSDPDSNFVIEHIELCHPENNTSSNIDDCKEVTSLKQTTSDCQQYSNGADEHLGKYVDCPHGCGDIVLATKLSTHLDLHFAEEATYENISSNQLESSKSWDAQETRRLHSYDDLNNVRDQHGPPVKSWLKGEKSIREILKERRPCSPSKVALAGSAKRLGRAELGPHAHEKHMPSWLRKILEKGAKTTHSNTIASDGTLQRHHSVENETTDVIPVLARLCEQDTSVQRAFFCSPKVHQIFKMSKEGGFCGYRNIQMLISYIKESRVSGHECFSEISPTILQLQDMIENAWDMGYNSIGRIETGGIRGTRKYIGTPEAQALFLSLGIQCEASSIGGTQDIRAHDALFLFIADYFRQTCSLDTKDKVLLTDLPPIYFQHQGHSLTIIGFEIRENGSANILVFDPMFKASPAVKRLKDTRALSTDPARVLKGYRRGAAYLQKYKVFEILKLSVSTALSQK